MRDLLKTILPYCRRYVPHYVLGALLVVVAAGSGILTPVWTGRTIDFILGDAVGLRGLMWRLGVIAGITACGAAALYFQRILIIGVSRNIEYRLRNDFFAHLTRLSPAFYDRMKTGNIVARATSDVDQIRMVLGPGIMHPITTFLTIPMAAYAMLSKSWPVTMYGFLPMLALPVLVNVLANQMYKRSLAIQENFADFSGRIQESISGVRVVRSFSQESHELETLGTLNQRNADLNMRLARIQAAFHPVIMSLYLLGNVIVIWVGSRYIAGSPAQAAADARLMTPGDLIAFLMLYRSLFFPILGFGWVVSIWQRASASMHRILLIWRQEPEIQDGPETDASLQTVRGGVAFRNVTYQYPQAERPSLENVSFEIPPGKTLGVVGSVGSGKSTIGQLLSRLYEPPRGAVLIDGRDVREFPLDVLHRSIGVVFQETYLFSDTLAGNICFARQGAVDEEEARRAARIACVAEDIEEFPAQYETRLGERGVNLSGGQKQRVALARAVVANTPILVLDDAFASVDTGTEDAILSGLRGVMEERTTILVSHRISTVQLADEIIVLDEGRIVERGTHEELVAHDGLYAETFRRQQLEQAIEEEK